MQTSTWPWLVKNVHAGLAFARKADAGAFLDARRNVDRQRALLLHMARALARLAGMLDHAPGAAAAVGDLAW